MVRRSPTQNHPYLQRPGNDLCIPVRDQLCQKAVGGRPSRHSASQSDSLALRCPSSMGEIRARAEKHIKAKEDQAGRIHAEKDTLIRSKIR
ncbi:hypothetical protein CR513_50180, partial [Mucuna pruriens]